LAITAFGITAYFNNGGTLEEAAAPSSMTAGATKRVSTMWSGY
jgi:hypothetical protein